MATVLMTCNETPTLDIVRKQKAGRWLIMRLGPTIHTGCCEARPHGELGRTCVSYYALLVSVRPVWRLGLGGCGLWKHFNTCFRGYFLADGDWNNDAAWDVACSRAAAFCALVLCRLPIALKQDSLAERSKAVAQGAIPQGRGFEPHSCHS